MSGEIVKALSADEARRLDSRIRLLSKATADNLTKLAELIEAAKHGEIHKALGYPSWTKYLASALAEANVAVGSRRADIVALLADEGMSNRAIAQAVGVTEITVRRDKIAVVRDEGPNLADVAKGRQVRHDVAPRSPKLEDRRAFFAAERVPANVIGLDGKKYPSNPPTPPKHRRGPLTDDAMRLAGDLSRLLNRVQKLLGDDRFARNKDVIGRTLRRDVTVGLELFTRLDAELKGRPVDGAVTK